MANQTLSAVYSSPQSNHPFQHTIPIETNNPKQSHLASLQTLVPQLQDEINVFLTERMEEDKRTAEAQGHKSVSEKEAQEEENYGEEVVEEDE